MLPRLLIALLVGLSLWLIVWSALVLRLDRRRHYGHLKYLAAPLDQAAARFTTSVRHGLDATILQDAMVAMGAKWTVVESPTVVVGWRSLATSDFFASWRQAGVEYTAVITAVEAGSTELSCYSRSRIPGLGRRADSRFLDDQVSRLASRIVAKSN